MRDKNIGTGREKDVVIGSEAQTIAEVRERVLLGEWQRQIVPQREIRGAQDHRSAGISDVSKSRLPAESSRWCSKAQ